MPTKEEHNFLKPYLLRITQSFIGVAHVVSLQFDIKRLHLSRTVSENSRIDLCVVCRFQCFIKVRWGLLQPMWWFVRAFDSYSCLRMRLR